MKNKKFLILLLTAGLILTGCGEREDIQSEKTVQQDSTEAETKSQPKKEKEEKASGTEADKEAEAETEETARKTEESELVNNGGYFVQYQDKLYFHAPDKEGMKESGIFGKYLSTDSGATVLYAYDLKTGELEELYHDRGYGPIVFSDGKMYLQEVETPNDEEVSVVEMIDFDADLPVEMTMGRLLGGDKEGKYAAAVWYADGVPTLCVFEGEERRQDIELEDYLSFVGIAQDTLIYQAGDYSENIIELKGLDIGTGEIKNFGELPQGEYVSYGVTDQFEEEDGQIYLTYGFYEGSGSFFSEAYLVEAEVGKENSLKAEKLDTGAEEPERSPAIVIKNGKAEVTEGIPWSAGLLNGSDKLGYYDENGKAVVVADGYGYEEDSDTVTEVELAEYIGQALYVVQNKQWRAPEDDMGWREAFRRKFTNVLRIDAKSGETETIVFCENPSLVEEDDPDDAWDDEDWDDTWDDEDWDDTWDDEDEDWDDDWEDDGDWDD